MEFLGDANAAIKSKKHETRLVFSRIPEKLHSITDLLPNSDRMRPDTHLIFISYRHVSLCVCVCVFYTQESTSLGLCFLLSFFFKPEPVITHHCSSAKAQEA